MTSLARLLNLSLRMKGFVIGTALSLALVAAASLTYLSADRESQAERNVGRSLRISQDVEKLKTAETDAVAGIRAFWITGDEKFADAVRRDLAGFDETMGMLAELTAQSPIQRIRLSKISSLQRARVELLFDAITRTRSGSMPESEYALALRQGEDNRSRMEALLEAIQQDENRSLNAELALLDRVRIVTKIRICVVFALGAASSFVLWILFATGIRRRILDLRNSLSNIGNGSVDLNRSDQLKAICDGLVEATQNLHQKNQVLEGAFQGVAQVDRAGHVRLNHACAELLSLPEHGPGANMLEMVPMEDRPVLDHALSRMRAEGRAEAPVRVLRPDGSLLDVALTFSAQSGGGFYVFVRDNSLQKNAESALMRAKDAAIASNVAKTSFLAKIGHEIRTPLNAILGSADLLADTELSKDQSEYVSIFRRNARRLVGLISDFLDFSKIEAGAVRIDRVPFRLRQTIHDVIGTFRDAAARKGLTLESQIDPGVPDLQLGDSQRLQQVLANLVSNALKFTVAGCVTVHVSITSGSAGGGVRFEVSDTGPGIRPADREKIFAPFTQLKAPHTTIHGTGLGLTICRELVQLMKGIIGVQSEEGLGSTFYFELPLEPADFPDSIHCSVIPSDPDLSDPPENRITLPFERIVRILVAEDAADNRLLTQAYLKDQPVSLRFAENGKEVMIALSEGEVFDLIFMDLDMPLVDGCAAARWVRAWQVQKKLPPTPIVALSAHAMHEMVRESLDAGCVAHVAKPVDRRTLLETIARYAQPGMERSLDPFRKPAFSDVASLVPDYLANQSKHIVEAREHLLHRDFGSIQRFGHNLKGTGRGYGFPEIEQLGRELEEAAGKNLESNIARSLEALHRFVSDAAAHSSHAPRVA